MDKAFILAEIKRTAEENGGIPLGSRSFKRTTGIRETDWLGKMWARWADAVKEAGLQPNQKTTRINDEQLLFNVAQLTQKLGHFPVARELRLHAHQNKGFPADNTIARLGPRYELMAKVRAFCANRSKLADVLSICDQELARNLPQNGDSKITSASEASFGCVYLIKAGRFYKIGRSNDAGRRGRELAIQLPEKAIRVHVIRTDDPVGIEAYWHKRFEQKRRNGEWFDLTAADVQTFKRRKSFM
jgi:hypothetical protein